MKASSQTHVCTTKVDSAEHYQDTACLARMQPRFPDKWGETKIVTAREFLELIIDTQRGE
jgi:hypothetical protein